MVMPSNGHHHRQFKLSFHFCLIVSTHFCYFERRESPALPHGHSLLSARPRHELSFISQLQTAIPHRLAFHPYQWGIWMSTNRTCSLAEVAQPFRVRERAKRSTFSFVHLFTPRVLHWLEGVGIYQKELQYGKRARSPSRGLSSTSGPRGKLFTSFPLFSSWIKTCALLPPLAIT